MLSSFIISKNKLSDYTFPLRFFLITHAFFFVYECTILVYFHVCIITCKLRGNSYANLFLLIYCKFFNEIFPERNLFPKKKPYVLPKICEE